MAVTSHAQGKGELLRRCGTTSVAMACVRPPESRRGREGAGCWVA